MEQQTPDTSDITDRNEASTEEKDFVTAEDQAPERPEWLPEKFKTPEAFAEGYSNLEKKFHQKESDLRAAWDKEIEEKHTKIDQQVLVIMYCQNLLMQNKHQIMNY